MMLCGINRPLMSRRKWQGRSLSPLDVALSAGITSGLSQSCTPKDYALRDHLWDELEDVAGLGSKGIHLIPGRWVREKNSRSVFFNSSGRDLGLKGKEADNSAIANSKENKARRESSI